MIGVKIPPVARPVEAEFRSEQDSATIQHQILEVKTAWEKPLI